MMPSNQNLKSLELESGILESQQISNYHEAAFYGLHEDYLHTSLHCSIILKKARKAARILIEQQLGSEIEPNSRNIFSQLFREVNLQNSFELALLFSPRKELL